MCFLERIMSKSTIWTKVLSTSICALGYIHLEKIILENLTVTQQNYSELQNLYIYTYANFASQNNPNLPTT